MGKIKPIIAFGALLLVLWFIVSGEEDRLSERIGYYMPSSSNTREILPNVVSPSKEMTAEQAIDEVLVYEREVEQLPFDTLYEAILHALLDQKEDINVSQYSMDHEEVYATRLQVIEDHPEIFYFDHEESYFWTDGTLEFNYLYSEEDIEAKRAALDNKVNTIIDRFISSNMSDLEKVIELHDYVVLNTVYDYENFENNTVPPLSFTAYGALINGVAVCDGYTKAMNLLLREVGVESKYVVGVANGNGHSWNLVHIDGEWYKLDATWNDPVPDREGRVSYQYFLITDDKLEQTHEWEKTDYPKATSTRFSYFEELVHSQRHGNIIYYTDDESLYQMNIDGTNKKKIAPVRAYEIAVGGDWLYFSNFSHGGYLFKIKKDGSELTELNDFYTTHILYEEGKLHFTEHETDERYYLEVE
ncbi:transglutaminase domain-containing protein [Evansella cellulosilytica]|uniref:Transglutaminase domain-containing protein n=1 Tax=Evansella cellulosilytica (strain ATCC 21833 / DSM 2522 / FERM P-1141 / JCM 9156 / N-4) TaxID=649639 RepID=E6TU11_EVAC2|nr:transglutaminase domain-containing protein [Evansella cellulosilytica]ADU32042.1 transglutaminase domain-containing protein [Evansella cellulosilytica DSM 2522]